MENIARLIGFNPQLVTREKLLNIGTFALPILFISGGFYFYTRPYTYVVHGEAAIVCSNNRVYPAEPNNIQNANALASGNISSNRDLSAADRNARVLCSYGMINSFIPFPVPASANYTVRPGIGGSPIDNPSGSGITYSNK